MANASDADRDPDVLRNKRHATRYRILVEIAQRQPAVSQREIADEIGITAQAVSDYLQTLVSNGYVEKHGRGRYEITKEGVDWLITRTDDLREFVERVSGEVVGNVDVDTAIATDDVDEGDTVALSMRDGTLHATPDADADGATAVAVTDADAGRDVAVTDFEGLVEYEPGTVTLLAVPRATRGGSRAVDLDAVSDHAGANDVVAAAGTEALVAARAADADPDARFGTADAVREAANRGLDVGLLVVEDVVAEHTGALRDADVSYEVVDVRDGETERRIEGGALPDDGNGDA